MFVQQGVGFAYQLLPMKMSLALGAILLLGHILDLRAVQGSDLFLRRVQGVFVSVSFVLAMLLSPSVTDPYPTRVDLQRGALFQAMKPDKSGESLMAISTSIAPFAEMMTFFDARWSGASMVLMPIPALIEQDGRYGIAKPLPEDIRVKWSGWFRKKVAARLAAYPPDRVAVEITPKPYFFDNAGLDMLAWLREDPDFDAAWRAANLAKTGEPITWDYRIYQMYLKAN
jgi:hypothetical protein